MADEPVRAADEPVRAVHVTGAPRSSNPLLQQQMSQFEREVMDVLKHALHTRMPLDQFQHAYHAHFGRQCRVADYGYTKLLELLEAAPVVTEVLQYNHSFLHHCMCRSDVHFCNLYRRMTTVVPRYEDAIWM